jgi:hypothetical protein
MYVFPKKIFMLWLQINEEEEEEEEEKGMARPRTQLPHSWACERFLYSQDRSTYFPK